MQDREGFRLVHDSVQSNHIHLLVEAESAERALATPREVRNALAYVLKNAQHHGSARKWLSDLI